MRIGMAIGFEMIQPAGKVNAQIIAKRGIVYIQLRGKTVEAPLVIERADKQAPGSVVRSLLHHHMRPVLIRESNAGLYLGRI